jgi:uncharacterized membrane protein
MLDLVKKKVHPIFKQKWSFGQKAADALTSKMGSWGFILLFFLLLIVWMYINAHYLVHYYAGDPFDPYPFILLNLVLSCLAAIQAPIILMSQNREAQKDRVKSQYDHKVNLQSLKEIDSVRKQLSRIEKKLTKKR